MWHHINKMMYNKVATLIKHTDHSCVLLFTSEICSWTKKKYFRSFISVTQAWNGGRRITGRKNQQTDRRGETASSLVKTRDNLQTIYIICSEKWTVLRERSSTKTVSYEEQTVSKDKYPSIFSRQLEAIVFVILQISFTTCAVLILDTHQF